MDKPEWKNKQANWLYHDQCEIQEHCQKSTKQHILARKCKPKPTTQGANDAAILQRSKKYKKPIPTETGKNLKYDVKELRENPEKLTQAYQKYDEQKGTQHQDNNQEHEWKNWETYQKRLGKLLEEAYPLKKKDTGIAEPKWTTLMEKWGTDKEKEEIDQSYKKKECITEGDRQGRKWTNKTAKTRTEEKY